MKNEWQLEKVASIPEIPYLDGISFNEGQIKFNLEFEGFNKTLIFDDIFSYRVIGESNAFLTLSYHKFDGENWLFRSINSKFTKWFDEESESIYENQYLSYMIVTTDYIIEVLAKNPPIIS